MPNAAWKFHFHILPPRQNMLDIAKGERCELESLKFKNRSPLRWAFSLRRRVPICAPKKLQKHWRKKDYRWNYWPLESSRKADSGGYCVRKQGKSWAPWAMALPSEKQSFSWQIGNRRREKKTWLDSDDKSEPRNSSMAIIEGTFPYFSMEHDFIAQVCAKEQVPAILLVGGFNSQ